MFTDTVIKSSMIVKEVTFGALGGGLSAAIASAVTRSPPEKRFNISQVPSIEQTKSAD